MKEVQLVELISSWVKDDLILSKHFEVDSNHIMEICRQSRREYNLLRGPMSSRSYAYIHNNFVSLHENGYKTGKELHCIMPDFFVLLREFLQKNHNEVLWCKETI